MATDKTKVEKQPDLDRVPSGIPGLDETIGGGFERNSSILLAGDAGSGKTTFAMQFIYKGAQDYDEPGVYITFEEPREALLRHMSEYNWNLEKLERAGKIAILQYKPHEVQKLLEEGGGTVYDLVNSIGAKRLAIDSLTSFGLLFESQYQTRENELELLELLRNWKTTSMLVSEVSALDERRASLDGGGAEFLTDSVLLLYHSHKESERVRAFEVLKMRGSQHTERVFPLEFTAGEGISIRSKM
ncbi:Circadian clock protein kinase KaiC [Candidatus Gugararchaeum adminiculabundum]|nr:Circadian clock protein kinase KaiC [Candidatus Gugararchaeum adminiculabundum]